MSRFYYWLLPFMLLACQAKQTPESAHADTHNNSADLEAREDSLELVQAYAAQALIEHTVLAGVETKVAHAQATDDAADDPAIWIHPTDRMRSLVFGTNKQGGVAAYDLRGQEVAYYPVGKANNVDILYDFLLGQTKITLLGYSNRSDQSIDLFQVDPMDGRLTDVAAGPLAIDPQLIDDIYGFCFASMGGQHYAIINGKNGLVQQFKLQTTDSNTVSLQLVRTVSFATQTEGMVADVALGHLYVGEENRGIWKLQIDPADTSRQLLNGSTASNPQISYDIEGLSIYRSGAEGYLLASVQGNFSYAVFDLGNHNAYLGSFKIAGGTQCDGVEETDGIDVVSDSLGPAYPAGLFVAQDGFNFDGDSLQAQNFKYVDWRAIQW